MNLNMNVTTTRDQVEAGAKQAAAALEGVLDSVVLAEAIEGVVNSLPPEVLPEGAVTLAVALHDSETSTQCSVSVTVVKAGE